MPGRPIPVIYRPLQPAPPVLVADTSRIRAELGWTPRRCSLTQVITDAWQAVRAALKAPVSSPAHAAGDLQGKP